MNTFDEALNLVRHLSEPDQRELAAWLADSLEDVWRVAEAAPRYGAAAENRETFTLEEYLAFEESSPDRHEYVGGQIYAMSEPLQPHKLIAGNIFAALHAHLRGKPCRPYQHDTKVQIRVRDDDYVYYPDVLVSCGQERDAKGRFIEEHRLVMEVMSRSTERIDRREKAYTYRELPSIEEIVLISQKATHVTLYRRADEWAPVVLDSLDRALELKSIDLALPLQQIYEGLP